MTGRIIIVEQDSTEPMLWRYGLADAEGNLGEEVYVLNSDPAVGGPPEDLHGASLWVTAILLVGQAKGRTRIVYDLQPWLRDVTPQPPPRGPERPWERSTKGKSKGRGETLGERAHRDRRDQPRAAA